MEIQVRPNTDLFTIDADAIAHGCNCLGVMGRGVALQVKIRYPNAYEAYRDECRLHNYSDERLPGGAQLIKAHGKPYVFNLFTQYQMGRHAKLEYVNKAFRKMFYLAKQEDPQIASIAIPQIGAGIGGLDWSDVLYEIEKAEESEPWNGTLIIAIRD